MASYFHSEIQMIYYHTMANIEKNFLLYISSMKPFVEKSAIFEIFTHSQSTVQRIFHMRPTSLISGGVLGLVEECHADPAELPAAEAVSVAAALG